MDRAEPSHVARAAAERPRALIVDDDPVGRMTLERLLERCGYDAACAPDGAVAVERFASERYDIVFMDLVMPVMDGIDATLRIKRLAGDEFVPVIFITVSADDADVARCIEAGGDDLLVKPFNLTVLTAKIRAMERIRALHRRLRAAGEHTAAEQALAKMILESAVMGPNVVPEGLAPHLSPATTFNGDILLTAYAPSGDLHVLLGDFTGHGLSATIGALPAAETFRAMTAKGFAPPAILEEINRKLKSLLPTGHFLAAIFVRVEVELRRAFAINCGMPDAVLMNGPDVDLAIPAHALPLGIVDSGDFAAAEISLPLIDGAHIVLLSDGVIEAHDASGQMFGTERLYRELSEGVRAGDCLGGVVSALGRFRGDTPAMDDISLVVITPGPSLFPKASARRAPPPSVAEPRAPDTGGWKLAFELRGQAMRTVSPVPMLVSVLGEFDELKPHGPALFTVLSELYNNAVDHGVLGLESSLKERDFAAYLHERDERLGHERDGRVTIELERAPGGDRGALEVRVRDTGAGFDPAAVPEPGSEQLHGRGLALVRALCASLDYAAAGNEARATYALGTGTTKEPGKD